MRMAWRAESNTAKASSPRRLTRVPPWLSMPSFAMPANFMASSAAASSPRSAVNRV